MMKAPVRTFIASAIGASLVLLSATGCIQGFEDHSHFELKPLFKYALAGRLDEVKRCVENSGDANGTDAVGETALMAAVVHDHVDVVQYLLNHGGNPWLKDSSGATALDIAKRGGQNRSADVLRDYMVRHSASEMRQSRCPVHDIALQRRTVYVPPASDDEDPSEEFLAFAESAKLGTPKSKFPYSMPWYASSSQGGNCTEAKTVLVCPECEKKMQEAWKAFEIKWRAEHDRASQTVH